MVVRRDIADALEMVDNDGLHFSLTTTHALEDCNLPILNYLYDICGEWDRTLYCLKHLARSVFALKFQECLWARGAGSNGKDTLAILMKSLSGVYFHNANTELLTNIRDLDSPSQSVFNLCGKRFCVIREIAKNIKIRAYIYKTISDSKGLLKARTLYGCDTEFPPMFLLYLCTNSPLEIDDDSGGSARRTRILDLPFNFCIDPQAPNEKPIDPNVEDNFLG